MNFVESFKSAVNDVNKQHKDISSVSNLSNESSKISRQWFFMSVLLRFNEVKFVNLSIRRRLVGRIFTDVVTIDAEFAELEIKTRIVIIDETHRMVTSCSYCVYSIAIMPCTNFPLDWCSSIVKANQ